jgi:hypothetical protein
LCICCICALVTNSVNKWCITFSKKQFFRKLRPAW